MSREWVRAAPISDIAHREASFFHGVSLHALGSAVARYQKFAYAGGLKVRRPASY